MAKLWSMAKTLLIGAVLVTIPSVLVFATLLLLPDWAIIAVLTTPGLLVLFWALGSMFEQTMKDRKLLKKRMGEL